MQAEQWKEIEKLFEASIELEPGQRADFLAEGLHPREVFNDAAALGADQRFVNPKDMRISVNVDNWLAERYGLFL